MYSHALLLQRNQARMLGHFFHSHKHVRQARGFGFADRSRELRSSFHCGYQSALVPPPKTLNHYLSELQEHQSIRVKRVRSCVGEQVKHSPSIPRLK
jgi:hypothetical protein